MSHRRAKRIRQELLPNVRKEAGASRGAVIRDLTEYEIKQNRFLVVKSTSPRAVIKRAKKYANE